MQTKHFHLRTPLGALGCVTLAALTLAGSSAHAQAKEIKIGVVFDLTGPLAAAGSNATYLGTKIAIDMINERGGVEGVKIKPIYVDAQSKVDVAINESERLINQEKVDLITGFFTSSQCVPIAQKVDAAKKFFWMSACSSSAVFRDRNLSYSFRSQIHSDQYGEASCAFINHYAKERLNKEPKDLRVAIIYEDGPYGVGVAQGNEEHCGKKYGMQVVMKEGYSATAPDLSPMITKLKRARPDVIFHTGYNPDITMFLRQAKEQNLKWQALVGHGSGYGQWDKLSATFGKDANYIFNLDAVAAQLIPAKSLKAGLPEITQEMVKRYKAETKVEEVPAHASMGMNQTWILLTDVLPRAIKKYGGYDSEALRKAALDTDIPAGGTIQGYGVKFPAPGSSMAGQSERAFPVLTQYIDNKTVPMWPLSVKAADPVLPLPKGHTYSSAR